MELFSKIILLGFLFSFVNLKAGESKIVRQINGLDINTSVGVSNSITDPAQASNSQFDMVSYQYEVHLEYSRDLKTDISNNVFTLGIIYEINNDGINRSLELFVDGTQSNQTLHAVDRFFMNSPDLDFKIISLGSNIGTSNVPLDVNFEVIQIKYTERCLQGVANAQIQNSGIDAQNNSTISWDYVLGAEEYELEWIFIENEDELFNDITVSNAFDYVNPLSASTVGAHYKEPVNVFTSKEHYNISLIYPKGNVFYRVRPIGTFLGFDCYGDWSQVNMISLLNNSFELNKSWQSVIGFAEDGKSKSSISYVDGSFRSRQNLTNLSTDQTAMAVEGLYNYEGEQTISILPTVINQNGLSYVSNLNIVDGGTDRYEKEYFDRDAPAPALDNDFGAAKYYSDKNDVSSVNRDLIPHAFGKPFVQTELLRDGSGRVAKTSGIGQDLEFGSGKETKFYYVNTNETELIRLFGSDVGEPLHYKKNLTLDPNGQLSVAYTDMFGRTVITALAGESPDNLHSINGENTMIETSLMPNNVLDVVSKTSNLTYTQANYLPGSDFDFEYSFDGIVNALGEPFNICQSCVYELKIYAEDPDGLIKPLSHNGVLVNEITETLDLGQLSSNDCSTPPSFNSTYSFSMDDCLKIGGYKIIKELSIVESSLYADFEQNLDQTFLDAYYQQILNSYLAQIDYTDCNFTCEQEYSLQCELDWFVDYATTNGGTEAQIQAAWDGLTELERTAYLDECVLDYCSEISIEQVEENEEAGCQSIMIDMKAQMSPGGEFFPTNWTLAAANIVGLTVSDASLRFQIVQAAQDCYGVDIVDANSPTGTIDENVLENLLVAEMTNNFCDPFAEILVYTEGHRELCHYEFCKEYESGKVFSFYLSNASTPAEGITNSNYNLGCPVPYSVNATIQNSSTNYSCSSLSVQDPFFLTGPGSQGAYLSDILGYLNDFNSSGLNVWEYYNPANTSITITTTANNPGSNPSNLNLGATASTQTISNFDVAAVHFQGIDLLDPIAVENRRWSLFKDAYAQLKYAIEEDIKANLPCAYLTDEFAIEIAPNVPSSPAEALDMVEDNLQGQASNDICYANEAYWRNLFLANCPNLTEIQFNTSVLPYLIDYCTLGNSIANPQGVILGEDYTNAMDGDNTNNTPSIDALILAVNAATSIGTCDFSMITCDPYTYATDESGNLLLHEVEYIDPKLQAILDELQNNYYKPGNQGSFENGITPFNASSSSTGMIDVHFDEYHIVNNTESYNAWAKLNITDCNGVSGYSGQSLITFVKSDGTVLTEFIKEIQSVVIDFSSPIFTAYNGISTPYQAANLKLNVKTPSSADLTIPVWVFFNSDCLTPSEIFQTPIVIDINPCNTITPDFEIAQDNCIDQLVAMATYMAEEAYDNYLEELYNSFASGYVDECLKFSETFDLSYDLNEYHYTLYYYDQAGNLTQTVPPEGVHPLDVATHIPNGVWDETEPSHNLKSQYVYNSYNQVIWQNTPDGGESNFWYNDIGQLLYSQNSEQEPDSKFSYTTYDNLGRIKEVGEKTTSVTWGTYESIQDDIDNFGLAGVNNQQTYTIYGDENILAASWQENLRGRVAEVRNINIDNLETSTKYSYDEHGNVKELRQIIDLFDEKTINYEYDLISGNVKRVIYQTGESDLFIHKYDYDADNRLTNVCTSSDGVLWDEDAEYFYYAHGPLARVEIGEDKVQGLDYYYTLHGWLKGINTPDMDYTSDVGKDGILEAGNSNINVARDEFALTLGYYDTDYSAIGGNNQGFAINAFSNFNQNLWNDVNNDNINDFGSGGLFNGNISYMISNIAPQLNDTPNEFEQESLIGMAYQYDQLNRIMAARSYHGFDGTSFNNRTNSLSADLNFFDTDYSYDANGNLKALSRSAKGVGVFDDFDYKYNDNGTNSILDPNFVLYNNKLRSVDDGINTSAAGEITTDIEKGQILDNYTYDNIGNLTSDFSEDITGIQWTVYGKVSAVIKSTGNNLYYSYDAMGNRVIKKEVSASGVTKTYYIRDASGNILSTYSELDNVLSAENEFGLFGSSRLGVKRLNTFYIYPSSDDFTRVVGDKYYELSNHLGNVNVVVSDRRLGQDGYIATEYDLNDGYQWCFSDGDLSERNGIGLSASLNNATLVNDVFGDLSAYSIGNNKWLQIGDEDDFDFGTSDFTVSVWAKKHANTSNWHGNVLVGKWISGSASQGQNEWNLTITNGQTGSGGPKFSVESGNGSSSIKSVASNQQIALNTWYHIVGQREGDYIKIFVNGTLENSVFIGNVSLNNVPNVELMVGRTNGIIFGKSVVDDLAIFERALSSSEIQDLYNRVNRCEGTEVPISPDGEADYYLADVISATDYYPFGMVMPGRFKQAPSGEEYRFGFNGMEKDGEGMGGGGSTYDYGFRIYNPQIAKFLSVDPLFQSYPFYTPYQFAGNKPIQFIDLDGLEEGSNSDTYNQQMALDNEIQDMSYMYGAGIIHGLNNSIKQGIANVFLNLGGNQLDASLIRFVASENGRDLSIYTDKQLSEIYTIDYEDNEPRVIVKRGVKESLLETGKDGLNLLAAFPPLKGAPMSMPIMVEGKPIVTKTLASSVKKYQNAIKVAEGGIKRIQNAANRIRRPIHLVGSRASGTSRLTSDFDYVITGIKSKEWTKIKNSLPGAANRADNQISRIDLFKGRLDTRKAHITITPK